MAVFQLFCVWLTIAVSHGLWQPVSGACSNATCNNCTQCACVRIGNFLATPQGSVLKVTLVSSNGTTVCPEATDSTSFSKPVRIDLPAKNGPDNYWRVMVTCPHEKFTVNMTDFLFVNSSAPNMTDYLISLYGNCTSKEPPQLWHNTTTTLTHPRALGVDQALITLKNKYTLPLLYSKNSDNCYKCADHQLGTIYPSEQVYIVLDMTFPVTITLRHSNGSHFCSESKSFNEHSKYLLIADTKGCDLIIVDNGLTIETYLPILYASVVILAMAVTWVILSIGYRCLRDHCHFHYKRVDRLAAKDLGSPQVLNRSQRYGTSGASGRSDERQPLIRDSHSSLNASSLIARGTGEPQGERESVGRQGNGVGEIQLLEKPKKYRLRSLDAFRGLSLTIMIFVNYGGGGYWFFNHSRWNGLTVADLVFPWFIWIMGVSIVFSFKARKKDVFWSRLYQVIRRSIILFGLGLFLNNGFRLTHWRIPGVLQRFGVTYFVVALTELFTAELYGRFRFTAWKPLRDLSNNWMQWLVLLSLECVWLAITFLLPVHNCPTGYLGPGGLGDHGRHWNCTGGAAGAIDRWVFTEHHIYQTPTCKELYDTGPYDPEGALGALNSIVLCFLGVQAGRILTHFSRSHLNILVRLVIWGLALGLLGAVLCEGQKNEGVIPLNKNLWSLSFILVMAGTGYLLLAAFYFLIDVIHWWNGSPFRYPGMNSIIVYVGSEILQNYFPFSWYTHAPIHLDELATNVVGVCLWLIISYYWYCIGFFVKI